MLSILNQAGKFFIATFDAMNVLWLASWYPNRVQPTNGDFIERHAKAVAPFVKQLIIININKDDSMPAGKVEIVQQQTSNITVFTAYYNTSSKGLTGKFFSQRKYQQLQLALYNKAVLLFGKPGIVHVHVAMKAGLFAVWLKKKFNIPYVVTEHWSGYFKESKPNIYRMGWLFRKLNNRVLKNASMLLPVTEHLAKAITNDFVKTQYKVIPNVVDTTIFFPAEKTVADVTRLIHASGMGDEKNVDLIIEALQIWKQRGGNFIMHFYGAKPEQYLQLVKDKNLDNQVFFHQEVAQPVLAKAMQESDALVMFSKYETFGCVLIEANAVGLPVIANRLPAFEEIIKNGANGLLAEDSTPEALATKLEAFEKMKNEVQKESISERARSLYSYDVVGAKIAAIYTSILSSNDSNQAQ